MPSSTPRPWTSDEDTSLKAAVAQYGDEPGMWKSIALHVPGRTNKACRKRWLHSLSPTVKKTPWTAEEDATLLSLYKSHNPPRWSLIAKHIPGRTDDACSKRYREALDPQLKRDDWTSDEDATLLQLTLQFGSKWTRVGQEMGRSGLGCRNRWRLLQRKQRPRNQPHPSGFNSPPPSFGHVSVYSPPAESSLMTFPLEAPAFSSTCSSIPSRDAPFGGESNVPGSSSVLVQPIQPQINPMHRPFIHDPPPGTISTSSSLSGALSSSVLQTPRHPSPLLTSPEPELLSVNNDILSACHSSPDLPPAASSTFGNPRSHSREISLSSQSSLEVTSAASIQGPDLDTELQTRASPANSSPKSRKRSRPCGSLLAPQKGPRLSSHLPATLDRTVLPYACGAAECWSAGTARFATASEVAEHRRVTHPTDDARDDDGKRFRCALQSCGKGWKNINGIQYHLQVSKSHFQAALSQTHMSSASAACDPHLSKKTTHKKEHRCTHAGCPNTYKQRSGLQYHLVHGHPTNVTQLEVLPPGLMQKFATGTLESTSTSTPPPGE